MFRHLENHLFIRFVQPFFIGEDEIGDAVAAVSIGNLTRAVEDDVEGFRMNAHFQIRGITGEVVQEVVNFIH